jgi:diphosphomevalonate decarboxylase
MNLSNCLTTSTIEFLPELTKDEVVINGQKVDDKALARTVAFLDVVREWSGMKTKAKVYSQNNFPSDAGIASSASAFSALALAGSRAAGLKLSAKKLSILARMGSGSACRSVVDGFGEWQKGTVSENSYAKQVAPVSHWDLVDIVAVVSAEKKKTGSTEGHNEAETSPYFRQRLVNLPKRISSLKKDFLKKDFDEFGKLLEEEAIDLHVMAMTSKPPIYYLNSGTFSVMAKLKELREKGTGGYFTMDAGPNVHVICQGKDALKINRELKKLPSVKFTIVNKPCKGTRLVSQTRQVARKGFS